VFFYVRALGWLPSKFFPMGKWEKLLLCFHRIETVKTHGGVLLIASRGSLQRALRSAPRRRAKAAFEHRTKSKSAAPTLAAAGIAAATSTDASNHLAASSASRRRRKPCIRTVLF
jgi:hypothetical protein